MVLKIANYFNTIEVAKIKMTATYIIIIGLKALVGN